MRVQVSGRARGSARVTTVVTALVVASSVVATVRAVPALGVVSGDSSLASVAVNLVSTLADESQLDAAKPACLAPRGAPIGSPLDVVPCGALDRAVWRQVTHVAGYTTFVLGDTAGHANEMCVDTADGRTTAGTAAVVGHCATSPTQRWFYDTGMQRYASAADRTQCLTAIAKHVTVLTVGDGATRSTTTYHIELEPCADGQASQRLVPVRRELRVTVHSAAALTLLGIDNAGGGVWDRTTSFETVTLIPGWYRFDRDRASGRCDDLDPATSSGRYAPSSVTPQLIVAVPNTTGPAFFDDTTLGVLMLHCPR